MSPFIAFLIFAGLVLIEMAAAHAWLPFYYLVGLPVYVRRFSVAPARTNASDSADLLARLNPAPIGQPSLEQHALPAPPGWLWLALREQMFENRPGLKYLPVMRAVLRVSTADGAALLTGYLNPSGLFALGYAVYRTLGERGFTPVAILIAFVLVMSYVAQRGVFDGAAKRLAE